MPEKTPLFECGHLIRIDDLHRKYMTYQPMLLANFPDKFAAVWSAGISVWETYKEAIDEVDWRVGLEGHFLVQRILPVPAPEKPDPLPSLATVSLPSGEAKTIKSVGFRPGVVKEGAMGLEVALEDVKAAKKPEEYGNPVVLRLMDEIRALHRKKARDYGKNFENFRQAGRIGIPAWKSAWMRALDKISRIDLFCVQGSLENEGVEDSLKDLAVLSLITLALIQEEQESKEGG